MIAVFRSSDLVVGLLLVAFGGLGTWLALGTSGGPAMRTLPPNTVPLICTIGIALCGAAIAIKGLILRDGPQITLPFDTRQAVVAVLFFAFFLAFEHVDYRLLILIFVPAVMAVLGCRSWKQLVLVPIAVALGIWGFFGELFNVFLPTWF